MIRPDHKWYDIHAAFDNFKLIIGLAVIAGFFILFISVQFIYIFGILFVVILSIRSTIGRRCPICDAALTEAGAEPDKDKAVDIYIIWQCPKDGYQEKEKIKVDSGLFRVN